MTTTDLGEFGWRERNMAAELLTVMCDNGLPDDFYDDEVTIMMNMNSGNVFLTNSEFQVAMIYGDALETWYTTPYDGHEGFKDELLEFFHNHPENWSEEDVQWLVDMEFINEVEYEAWMNNQDE